MNVNGEYRIPASRERIWAALRDPEALRACLPGCEEARRVDDGSYLGRIATQVGAVNAVFTGRVEVRDADYPRSYRVVARAESLSAGSAEADATVTLTAEAEGTLVAYRARIDPHGRMASVGPRLLQGLAFRMANEFFVRLIERIRPTHPTGEALDRAEPVPVGMPAGAIAPIAPAPEAVAVPGSNPLSAHALAQAPGPQPEQTPADWTRSKSVILAVGTLIWLFIAVLLLVPALS